MASFRIRRSPLFPRVLLIAACVIAASRALAASPPGGEVVVGNAGSARWTIPIEVPPGPGGLAPTLTLVYSSSAGDGPFGVGWRLPLGEISCSVRHGVPAYINPGVGNCPQFELDGELLNYNPGQTRYHTFVESFQRILKTPSGWEVTSPDGMMRRYGTTPDSRIVAPSGSVARWLLSEIVNPYGQRIEFRYDGTPSESATGSASFDAPLAGHAYIRRISYGPGSERAVEFDYEPRTDVIHDFSGGVERRIAYRATEIRIESNGDTHSRHLLGYDLADQIYTTDRSRLSWTQRFGTDCPPPDDPLEDCTGLTCSPFPVQFEVPVVSSTSRSSCLVATPSDGLRWPLGACLREALPERDVGGQAMDRLGLFVGRLAGEGLGERALSAALHGDTVESLRLRH